MFKKYKELSPIALRSYFLSLVSLVISCITVLFIAAATFGWLPK